MYYKYGICLLYNFLEGGFGMNNSKITFALYFGNRGFFPGEVIEEARREMVEAVINNGFDYITMDENLTRYGAVETRQEGKQYAEFLEANKGKFDGIILCMPNFSDENGAAEAFKNVNVPILVQAYPDEIGRMDFSHRRDAVCGKFAMCNVLRQCNIKFTLTQKMAVSPLDKSFSDDLKRFGAICRIVKGMRHFNVGAIGARTTAFKTVRTDEVALQGDNINMETIDLSYVFDMMDNADLNLLEKKRKYYSGITSFGSYPEEKLDNIARLGVAIDKLIDEYDLKAIAVRCWDEFVTRYNIAPCLVLSDLNERGIPAACELDINNAIMMYALCLASDKPVMLLDVNNNYGDEPNKNIMFHCSAVPSSFFEGETWISEHLMFKKSFGEGTGVGIVNGRIKSGEVTVGSIKTEAGKVSGFTTGGKLTDDKIDKEFFGTGIVYENPNLEAIFKYMCENGYKHHVAIAQGEWAGSVNEALNKYLEYNVDLL